MRYVDAVASLFQVPLEQFVTERKRLAGELKTAGDKDGAAKLAKLARPPISAWVVDQLWWHARAGFEALFETAQRLRDGKLDAMAAHRDAIAKLRAQATKILTDAEHGATEATLRRVTQTLSALAASGGWEPDLPGALSADREPPGFEAVGISNLTALVEPTRDATAHDGDASRHDSKAQEGHAHKRDGARAHDGHVHKRDGATARDDAGGRSPDRAEGASADRERREAAEAKHRQELETAAARAEAAAELRRAEAKRAQAAAERHRVEAALRTAQGDVAQREREVVKLERDLAAARHAVAQARAVAEALEERLAQLDN